MRFLSMLITWIKLRWRHLFGENGNKKMSGDTRTYEEMLDELRNARGKWESLGVKIAPTRYGAYERTLVDLIRFKNATQTEQSPTLTAEKTSRYYLTFPEISEFLFVSKWVLPVKEIATSDRAKEIFSGPELAKSEKDGRSPHARNTLFELFIAAVLIRAGITPSFLGIADIVANIDDWSAVIECKRPQNYDSAKKLLKEAREQLANRFKDGKGHSIGVIAVSLSKAVTAGDKILNQPTHTVAGKMLSDLLTRFKDENLPIWSANGHADLLLVMISVTGSLADTGGPYVMSQVIVSNSPHCTPVAMAKVQKLVELLKGSF